MTTEKVIEKIVSLAKSRGFIFPGSEIYGGLANAWDYGPLGVELKNNIKKAWWKKFIQQSEYNVGLDSAILMNPKTWEASGHIEGFRDPLMDCKKCKSRFRADKLIEEYMHRHNNKAIVEFWDNEKMKSYIKEKDIVCPECGSNDFTDIRQFNLMFKTFQGVTEDSGTEIYLRPETAQGIFLNFKNILRASRKKIPFGIGQIGKAFRNEITPGNFIFRTREFEQMELEFFCKPQEDMKWFDYWKDFCKDWLLGLNLNEENLRFRDHSEKELSHYSKATTDFEYKFPFGWEELWGIANRTDFDLKQHGKYSGESFIYQDPITDEEYVPYCIEPSVGVDRLILAFLVDSYTEEIVNEKETRVVLKLHPTLSPFKAAVFPLSKKLKEQTLEIYKRLSESYMVDYDDSGSIGRRYRRHDEIGTPFCITFDFDSLEDNCVTVRYRDTMVQERVDIEGLKCYLDEKLKY